MAVIPRSPTGPAFSRWESSNTMNPAPTAAPPMPSRATTMARATAGHVQRTSRLRLMAMELLLKPGSVRHTGLARG